MKNKTKAFVISFIFGIVLAYFSYSSIDLKHALISFKMFTIKVFIIYLSAIVGIEFFLTLRWKLILNDYNIKKIPFLLLFFYRMSGYAIGYLSPQPHVGGEPVRALLLKRNKVNFKKAISTVVVDKSMQITTDVFFSIIGIFLLLLHISFTKKIIFLIVIMNIVPVVLLYLYFRAMIKNKPFFSLPFEIKFLSRFKKMRRLKKDIREVEKNINYFYKNHMKTFYTILGINLTLWILMVIEYGSALSLFGFKPELLTIFALLGGVALSYSLPVPMALGVLEISQISAFSILKLKKAVGISVSLLVRIKDIVRSVIGLISLFYFGIRWRFIADEIKGNPKDLQD